MSLRVVYTDDFPADVAVQARWYARQRDEALALDYLSGRHGFAVDWPTFQEREDIKREFAQGGSYVLTLPESRNDKLGDAVDQKVARRIADELASRVWDSYRKKTAHKQVKYLILTGGGSVAPLVRDAIHTQFSSAKVIWANVDGMETKIEPEEVGDLRRWPDTGETLARLATAVGAASVILDLPADSPLKEEVSIGPIESPWIPCGCQGGNKECMRCGGRGMYLRQGT